MLNSEADREKFLACLMTNHYHMVIEISEGNLSRIMEHINDSYKSQGKIRSFKVFRISFVIFAGLVLMVYAHT